MATKRDNTTSLGEVILFNVLCAAALAVSAWLMHDGVNALLGGHISTRDLFSLLLGLWIAIPIIKGA